MIDIFISHSSQDSVLAEQLVDLLRTALNIRASEIRCTSVNGHRLPVGADSDEQLRQEVFDAKAFLGILSSASLASAYVLFELGARWGAKKHLAPLLAPGLTSHALKGPIAGLNALSCDSASQLHQLIQDLGRILGVAPEAPQVYQAKIDALIKYAAAVPAQSSREEQPQSPRLELDFCRTKVSENRGVFAYNEAGIECLTVRVHNMAAAEGQAGFDAKAVFASLVFTHGSSRTVIERACWLDHEENEIPINVGQTVNILIGFPFVQEFTWISVNNPHSSQYHLGKWNPPSPELEQRTVPWPDESSLSIDIRVISNATATRGVTFRQRKMQLDRRSTSYHGEWI